MTEVTRISPEQAKQKSMSGEALLVCAYDKDEKFEKNHLEGAISLANFREKVPGLAKDQEVVFYCA